MSGLGVAGRGKARVDRRLLKLGTILGGKRPVTTAFRGRDWIG